MPRIILVVLLFSLSQKKINAQERFFSLYGGISHYSGDLGNAGIPKIVYPAYGIGFSVLLNDKLSFDFNLYNGKVGGDDKKSPKTKERNLNFTSNLTEFSTLVNYHFFNLSDYKISPVVFTGISIFNFAPYAKLSNGAVVQLKRLSTEGQGFFKDRKNYKTTQLAIPIGAGFTWAINENKRLTFFTGLRKTFTDYIDDVSTTYVDRTTLQNAKGGDAVVMAFRGNEINSSLTYPAEGTQRGNPKNKDYYYFSGISFQFRMNPPKGKRWDSNSRASQRRRKSSTKCPTVF